MFIFLCWCNQSAESCCSCIIVYSYHLLRFFITIYVFEGNVIFSCLAGEYSCICCLSCNGWQLIQRVLVIFTIHPMIKRIGF